jgi:hypothetical protein
VPQLPARHACVEWQQQFEVMWAAECRRAKPSLWRVMWLMSRSRLLSSGILRLIEVILIFVILVCLREVTSYLNPGSSVSVRTALANTFGLFISAAAKAVVRQYAAAISAQNGIDLHSALLAALYVKALHLSTNVSKGTVMTLVSTDCSRVRVLLNRIHGIVRGSPVSSCLLSLQCCALLRHLSDPVVLALLVVARRSGPHRCVSSWRWRCASGSWACRRSPLRSSRC